MVYPLLTLYYTCILYTTLHNVHIVYTHCILYTAALYCVCHADIRNTYVHTPIHNTIYTVYYIYCIQLRVTRSVSKAWALSNGKKPPPERAETLKLVSIYSIVYIHV